MVSRACKLLSNFNQAAFKFVHPKPPSAAGENPARVVTSYELAVQFNYDQEEKRHLLDVFQINPSTFQ
jgi:hypothetical protein